MQFPRIKVSLAISVVLALQFFVSSAMAGTAAEIRDWREDLHFMAVQMEKTHKNLYHSISRNDFAARVEGLDARIPSLTRAEFIVGLAQIVAAVGDGHTNIYPTRDAKIGFHTLPVAFTYFGDGLYVRAVPQSERSLLGARVLRIGNLSTEEAYAAVRTMVGHENESGVRYWAQYLLAMPEVLEALHITSSVDDVPLTLQTQAGESHVTLRPMGLAPLMSGDTSTLFERQPGWVDVRDLAPGPDPLWLQDLTRTFRIERVGQLLYVQINKIGNAPDETLERFAQRLRGEISSMKPDKVAIDLRQNRGGDGTLIIPLVRSLIQSENIDQPGRLFAIIGPATFSAAQMLVDDLEKYTNVLFVGEPTGSKGNAYGDSRKIILPNTGVTVRASIYYWQDWHPLDTRDATVPQIPASLTFKDYSEKVDPAIRAILAYKP